MEGHVLYCITYLGMGTHPLDNIYPELLFLHVNLTCTHACMRRPMNINEFLRKEAQNERREVESFSRYVMDKLKKYQ